MTKPRKKYSNQFKIDAVELVLEQGYKISEAAGNLEIHPNPLRNWKREFENNQRKAFDGAALGTPEQLELERLRKENARLGMEKEILKKAAAFFAKESM